VENTSTLGQETRQVLLDAGWFPDRSVDTARWEAELVADGFPPLHEVARQFLGEYGGLTFPLSGPGITRAREPFHLVPTVCSGEADRFIDWSNHIQRSVAPIGEIASGTCACAFLGIDERGEILVVVDRLATFGRMPYAMEGLVLGYMPREID
jgi:hypothetical protein